jgi:Spy/CpxP family protein refolding chaperone
VNNNQQQAFRGIENSIPDLTDKQKTEIKTLRVAHMKEVQQLKNKMDIKRAELKALQTQEKPDLNAINKKSKKRQL